MKRFKKTEWAAFAIPFAVMLAGCIGSGIFPFGNQSFLRNDLYNQYMPFFQAFHDKIWQGEGLSYGFELGLGSGFAALFGYYLSSPVNWLVALCPRTFIAEFITLLILGKMGLAGVTFAYYLRKHFGKEDMGILLFSSAYALSGFMAAYQWNIMWLDVVVLAPVVLWALEELIETGKGTKYCLFLALSIFTNFYLSIMLCIFLVLYFVAVIIWKPWRIKWRRSLQFVWYSLLAGGMNGGLLLPVYVALSGTQFTEFKFPEKIKWYMNALEEMSRHCMGVSMKVQADNWPNIYCGVAIFLLVPLFLFNRKISWKNKLSKLFLAGIFLVSFSCNVPDFIWHGFNYPDSLPARQAYLYIWLLLVMGYEAYIHLHALRLWQIVIAGGLSFGIVLTAWIKTDVDGTGWWTYVLTLVFLALYIALLTTRYFWNYPRVRGSWRKGKYRRLFTNRYRGVKVLVLLLVVVELACNMYMTSIRTVNRKSYMEHYENREGAVEWMKSRDDGLYRTEIFDRLTKNDSMMWDINTATIFSSTINARVVDFYHSMGLGTTKVSAWYQGATPLISAMLGVKYVIGKDDTMDNDLYDLIYSDETGFLYRCNYFLPMGYVVAPEIEETWDLEKYNPIGAQNSLCQLLGAGGALFSPVDNTKIDNRTRTISVQEDSYIFVSLGNNGLSEVEYTKGGETKKFSQVYFDYLLDLGLVKAGETVTLKAVQEDRKFNSFHAYALDLQVLEEAVNAMAQTPLEITEHKSDYVRGNVTLKETGKLIFSIPFEKGWTLYVNGQETTLESFKDTFMAVTLEPGSYDVALEYKTPGLASGIALSAISFTLFLVYTKLFGASWVRKFLPNSRMEQNQNRE